VIGEKEKAKMATFPIDWYRAGFYRVGIEANSHTVIPVGISNVCLTRRKGQC